MSILVRRLALAYACDELGGRHTSLFEVQGKGQ